jgi:hypothetical protein
MAFEVQPAADIAFEDAVMASKYKMNTVVIQNNT